MFSVSKVNWFITHFLTAISQIWFHKHRNKLLNKDKMKKNKTINNITISLLSVFILAYSTILQFSMPSIVLCFGDDGHIAFEQSDDNYQCVDFGDNKDHPLNKHKNLSHQENDCHDIPLMNVLSALYLEKDGKIKTLKLTAFDPKINTIKTHLVSHFDIHKDFTIIHFSMKSLQATILLI